MYQGYILPQILLLHELMMLMFHYHALVSLSPPSGKHSNPHPMQNQIEPFQRNF